MLPSFALTPIKISQALRNKLPASEKSQIEELLRTKSIICNLCGGDLDFDTDIIEADHDEPDAEGGKTEARNLFLVHKECNSFKQDQPTDRVRPFLKFRRFARQHEPFYLSNALQFFSITSITPNYKFTGGSTGKFQLSYATKTESASIFQEPSGPLSKRHEGESYQFSFVELPFNWITNDEEVQPRRIYYKHVWNIYKDLLKNPLHEAPALRLVKIDSSRCELKMFDGQHKTVAAMLAKYETLVFKVYLDLNTQEANILVNSIQDQLTKQTLNVVESVNKFSSEFASDWEDYIQRVEETHASERGFIDSLEKGSRSRAQKALKAKLQADFFSEESNVELSEWLTDRRTDNAITKKSFSDKFLLKLISPKPLIAKGREGSKQRIQERVNATRISKFMLDNYWEVEDADNCSESDIARSSRLRKQVSLQVSAELFRYLFQFVTPPVEREDDVFLLKELSQDEWERVEKWAKVYFDHPYWTSERNLHGKSAVGDADNHLERNEKEKFNAIREGRLYATFPYAVKPTLPSEWGS